MRVQGSPLANRLQEYIASRTVARDAGVEGVEYVRDAEQSERVQRATSERADAAPPERAGAVELQALLDPEEEALIYELFPRTGPDWGARAYRSAQELSAAPPGESGGKHVDFVA